MDITSTWILEQAKNCYQIEFISEIHMGESGNKVFEVQRDEASFILKVTECDAVEQKHIELQLEWVEYLSNHMEGIFKPVRSLNHRLLETVSTDSGFYCMFLQEKAPGKLIDVDDPNEFNETLFYNLGFLMGKIHKYTASYERMVIDSRFVWDNDQYSWRGNVPIKDDEVRPYDQKYKDELNTLPIARDSYGIIHYDIHTKNFFVDKDNITIFDFDACQFNWYAADIASTLFFMVQAAAGPLKHQSEEERSAFAEYFLTAYLKGYTQTYVLSEFWLRSLDVFMKYQMIDEYRSAQDYLKDELGPQHQCYLDWFKHRIIHNISYVSIDYTSVMDHIPGIIRD